MNWGDYDQVFAFVLFVILVLVAIIIVTIFHPMFTVVMVLLIGVALAVTKAIVYCHNKYGKDN